MHYGRVSVCGYTRSRGPGFSQLSFPPTPPPGPSQKKKGKGLIKSDETNITAGAAAGISIAAILGLPLLCCFAFCINVNMRFSGERRSKYIKWRFSHTNAFITCGYLPKETRDALWAEIQAPKLSTVDITLASRDPISKASLSV